MKLYLSGPITNCPDFNAPAFAAAAKSLRAQGLDVVSPHEVPHPENGVVGSLPWTDYMRGDLVAMLRDCDAIALLPGWPKSRGAQLELFNALALGMRVFYLIDGGLRSAEDSCAISACAAE